MLITTKGTNNLYEIKTKTDWSICLSFTKKKEFIIAYKTHKTHIFIDLLENKVLLNFGFSDKLKEKIKIDKKPISLPEPSMPSNIFNCNACQIKTNEI